MSDHILVIHNNQLIILLLYRFPALFDAIFEINFKLCVEGNNNRTWMINVNDQLIDLDVIYTIELQQQHSISYKTKF